MAHPYHHATASVKKRGGDVSDYLPLHTWFDQSKSIAADFRHRALRNHAEGIFMLETVFGPTITLSTGRVIPTRWGGEQHVQQDLGFIPSFADWMRAIRPLPWMGRSARIEDRPRPTSPGPSWATARREMACTSVAATKSPSLRCGDAIPDTVTPFPVCRCCAFGTNSGPCRSA
jgi:hypothetical protein